MAGEKLRILGSYFPDFADWLKKSAQQAPDYVRLAEKQLAELPEAAIRKACEKILLEGETIRWQKLPTTVRNLAKRYLTRIEVAKWQRIVEGTETLACKLCRDTGYVDILHPDTVAETLRTGKPPPFPYEAVALCTCPKGVAIKEANLRADRQHRRNIATYDPKRHVLRVVGILPMEQYQQLLGSVAESRRIEGEPPDIVARLADSTRCYERPH